MSIVCCLTWLRMWGMNAGPSRGAFSAGKTALWPVCVSDETQELQVWWYAFGLAPRSEHVVRYMEFVVFPAVVLAEKSLHRSPRYRDCSQKRYIRKNLFGSPSFFIIRRPNENLGTYSHLRNLSSYSAVTCMMCSTILFATEVTLFTPRGKRTAHSLKT